MNTDLSQHRKRLKQMLWRTRAPDTRGPLCPICGKEITLGDGGQLHEVFLTRGDAQGLPEEMRRQIFVPENCVILCSEACHIQAAARAGKALCAHQILLFEGFEQVSTWLRETGRDWKGTQPEIEQRYLRELMLTLSTLNGLSGSITAAMHGSRKRWKAEDFQ